MRSRVVFAIAAVLALPLALLAAAPAAAEPGLGHDLTVTVEPGTQTGINQTAWIPSSTAPTLLVDAATHVTADTLFEVLEGATLLDACTIPTLAIACVVVLPTFAPGEHTLTYRFSNTIGTVSFTGSIFSVIQLPPSIAIEWQDADGDWIDGGGIGLPLFEAATTAARCVVTNTSNAPITFDSFNAEANFTAAPPATTQITGTLTASQQGVYHFYSGSVAGLSGHQCSGTVLFPGGAGGSGTGNGGAIVPIAGALTASPLTPGATVALAGAGLSNGPVSPLVITFDGVPVSGSPLSPVAAAFDLDVILPALLTPGGHTIAVHYDLSGLLVTWAAFTIDVPGLANGGVDPAPWLGLAALLLLIGAVLVIAVPSRARATA